MPVKFRQWLPVKLDQNANARFIFTKCKLHLVLVRQVETISTFSILETEGDLAMDKNGELLSGEFGRVIEKDIRRVMDRTCGEL